MQAEQPLAIVVTAAMVVPVATTATAMIAAVVVAMVTMANP